MYTVHNGTILKTKKTLNKLYYETIKNKIMGDGFTFNK